MTEVITEVEGAPEGCSVDDPIVYDPPAQPEGAEPSDQFIQHGTSVTAYISCPPEPTEGEEGSTEEGTTEEGTTEEGTTEEETTEEGTTEEGTTDGSTTDETTPDEGTTDESTTDDGSAAEETG